MIIVRTRKRVILAAVAPLLFVGCGEESGLPVTPDVKLTNPGDKETTGFDPSNPLGGGEKSAAKAKGGAK